MLRLLMNLMIPKETPFGNFEFDFKDLLWGQLIFAE